MTSVFFSLELSSSPLQALALQSIEAEGFQAPSSLVLERVVRFALRCTDMLYAVALVKPEDQQLREFFIHCILSAVNRPAGVSDAAAE